MTALPPILETDGVAELLKCSPRTVEDKARAGTLPGLKVGESWIFPTDALLEAVNELARANMVREPVRAIGVQVKPPRRGRPTLPQFDRAT